jgi:hypothetical protein
VQRLVGLAQGNGDMLVQRRCFGRINFTEAPIRPSQCAGPAQAGGISSVRLPFLSLGWRL